MNVIRTANGEDTLSIVQLVKVMIGDQNPDEVACKIVQDFFANLQFAVFVCEEKSEVKGFAVSKLESFEGANGVSEIVWLGIEQKYKRQGLGTLLVHHIEQYATENGIRKLYIKINSSNTKAACFWIMQNYEFEARLLDFGWEGHDDYLLGKNLSKDQSIISSST